VEAARLPKDLLGMPDATIYLFTLLSDLLSVLLQPSQDLR
jgi:hypothetical protein